MPITQQSSRPVCSSLEDPLDGYAREEAQDGLSFWCSRLTCTIAPNRRFTVNKNAQHMLVG